MASKEKAFALALSVTKAFYLACQILQEEQGMFPTPPERDTLFEPQHDDDTKVIQAELSKRKSMCVWAVYRPLTFVMLLSWCFIRSVLLL